MGSRFAVRPRTGRVMARSTTMAGDMPAAAPNRPRRPRHRWIALAVAIAATVAPVSAQVTTAPTTAASRGDTLVLTLPSAIDLALERATPVLAGRDTVRFAGAAVLEAYGRFLPAVAAGASDAVESGRPLLSLTSAGPADATFRVTALQLSTRLNVFNAMRDRNDLRAATRTREAATLSLAPAATAGRKRP